ncbi:hypothetical protein SDC9_90733 [bioreactor metagenome]|uniref:Uncharacterized protein n=1 Tax=bioreactor metagenome TaxID=1076179 RepID=A0A644ZT44_9ZZZZ|nr:hypothetical protein [Erysipelotrichaceae bacterium]
MTTATLITYVVIAAGVAAIIKVLSSGRGKVDIPGISIQWSK